jgi:tetratricopeptide (TPR) repeat protein
VLEGTSLRRPKPLLLLAYLALEGPKPRRYLAELFFGDVKDPYDSLSTALKYLRQHSASALNVQPKTVSTEVTCDVRVLFQVLEEGHVAEAVSHYRGPFLSTLDLTLGEELENWVYQQQDGIAQRFRLVVLEHVEGQGETREAVRLIEQVWRLTKDQGTDSVILNRLYQSLTAGKSPLAQEVRRYAAEYGMPLEIRHPRTADDSEPSPKGSAFTNELPLHALELSRRLEELRHSTEGLTLCLWGPPGIGKTWTVEQISSALSFPVYRVLAAVNPSHLARHLPRASALPTWARTALSRLAADQPVERVAAADALAALLAAHAPTVLHIEDLHDATEEQTELWTELARAVRRSPGVGLLATGRQPPPTGFEPGPLPALTLPETARMLAEEAGSTTPPEAVGWIHAQTLGNPLFSLEYYRYLRQQGSLWHGGRSWRWREPEAPHVPTSVEFLISEFIARLELDETVRIFMQVKALLPLEASDAVVAQVMGVNEEAFGEAKRVLVQYGVLRSDSFVHPLYREVLNDSIVGADRRRLAEQAVASLGESHPELAAPFASAANLSSEASLKLLTGAAEHALAHGRVRQAGELFAAAAEHAQGPPRQTLLLRAADCLQDVHTLQARALAEQVLAADPQNIEATLLLARCLVVLGEGEKAESVLRRAQLPASAQQRWFDVLVTLRTERCDYQGAVTAWESHPDLQAGAHPNTKRDAAFSLVNLGRFGDAGSLLSRTLRDACLAPEARAALLETQAVIAYYEGRTQDSLALLDESIVLLRRVGETASAARLMHALRFRTVVYWAFLRQYDAIRDTEEAMRLAGELGSGRDYAIAQTYLGVPLTELGDYERAEEVLLESRRVLLRSDAREHLAACEAILSGVYLNWQRPDTAPRALRHAYTSLRISQELGAPVLLSQSCFYVAWAELVVGDAEKAYQYASSGLEAAAEVGQSRVVALCLWLRGLALERLGRLDEAIRDLDEAVEMAMTMGLEGHRLIFLVESDRLRNYREAFQRHLLELEPYNVSGYRIPAREDYVREKGLLG